MDASASFAACSRSAISTRIRSSAALCSRSAVWWFSKARRPITYGVSTRARQIALVAAAATATDGDAYGDRNQRSGPATEPTTPTATTQRAAEPGTQRATDQLTTGTTTRTSVGHGSTTRCRMDAAVHPSIISKGDVRRTNTGRHIRMPVTARSAA